MPVKLYILGNRAKTFRALFHEPLFLSTAKIYYCYYSQSKLPWSNSQTLLERCYVTCYRYCSKRSSNILHRENRFENLLAQAYREFSNIVNC